MARAWLQYDRASDSWINWPAGTLPSPESVFRAEFLNQFISWMRYTGNFAFDGSVEYPGFLSPGSSIQSAAFWNSIGQFDVLDNPDLTDNAWMDLDASDLSTPDEEIAEDLLEDSTAYSAAAPYAEISRGDIIQPASSSACPMRNMLLRARTRLDLCRVVKVPWASCVSSHSQTDQLSQDRADPGSTICYSTYPPGASGFTPMQVGVYTLYFNPWGDIPEWHIWRNQWITAIYAHLTTSAAAQVPHDLCMASKRNALGDNADWTLPLDWWSSDYGIYSRFWLSGLTTTAADILDGATFAAETLAYRNVTQHAAAKLEHFYAVLLDELPAAFVPPE
ncbi:MAG: hypothetical protein WCY59_08705 [Anaerovoracaceae bacterium]